MTWSKAWGIPYSGGLEFKSQDHDLESEVEALGQ